MAVRGGLERAGVRPQRHAWSACGSTGQCRSVNQMIAAVKNRPRPHSSPQDIFIHAVATATCQVGGAMAALVERPSASVSSVWIFYDFL